VLSKLEKFNNYSHNALPNLIMPILFIK